MFGFIPYRPAAQMSPYHSKVGERLQHMGNALWIGIVEAMVAGMHQHGQSPFLTDGIDFHAPWVIGCNSLNVRMKLYSPKVQLLQMVDVLFHLQAVGVHRTQTGHQAIAVGHGRRNKLVDALGLVGCGCYRKDHIMVDAQSGSQFIKLADLAVIDAGQMVKTTGAGHGPFGNGVRIDVTMTINDPRHGVPRYFCRPKTSMERSRILNFWILPAAFMGKSSTIIK